MRADDWAAGHADNVQAGLLAGVAAAIDQDPQILHLRDKIFALDGQWDRRVETAAAELIGHVVVQPGDPETQLVPRTKVRERRLVVPEIIAVLFLERAAVLPAKHHCDLAVLLGG